MTPGGPVANENVDNVDDVLKSIRAQLVKLRDELEARAAHLREQVAELEEDDRRVYEELRRIQQSRGRQYLLGLRRQAGRITDVIRHPGWAAGRVASRVGQLPVISQIDHAYRRGCVATTRLHGRPFTEQVSDLDPADAIRWIGRVTMGGGSYDALLCHPHSRVAFTVTAPPGARVVCPCGVVPRVWADILGGVEFRVEVRAARSGWSDTRVLRLDPARNWSDRRWRDIVIRPPLTASDDLTIVLETSLPPGATHNFAWAIWGDPRVEWRRSIAEMRRALRSTAARMRHGGFGGVVAELRRSADNTRDDVRYLRWLELNTPMGERLEELRKESDRLPWRPLISVVTPTYNTNPVWLRACIDSVRAQAYTNWELCIADDASTSPETVAILEQYAKQDARIKFTRLERNSHISAASNAALQLAGGEFVAFLDHDDELAPEALFQIARHLNDHRDADMIYSDEDKLDPGGARCDVYFKPGWSPEHFLTCMYTCHLMVVRRSVLDAVEGFRVGFEGAQDYDLVLRIMERTTRIHHVPKVLYHWRKHPQSTASTGEAKTWAIDAGRRALVDCVRRRELDAEVLSGGAQGLYRVRYKIKGEPQVSLVIPTRGGQPRTSGGQQNDLLARCIRSVVQKTLYRHYEIVVVTDSDELTAATREALAEAPRVRLVRYEAPGPFNYSRKMNFGVAQASGEQIVLFNDDLEVITSEWLTAMLEYSQQPEIGAVGAKLLYPDGRLQHVGMVLGVNGVAAHAFHQHPGSSTGYASSTISVRNYSAVTAACLMTRREVFDQVGGFNEDLAVDFNDVDLCLRIQRAGYRTVFTPFAQLYHHESASFGPRTQNPVELERMRDLWGGVIDRDPYYNPNLTRDFADYRINVPD